MMDIVVDIDALCLILWQRMISVSVNSECQYQTSPSVFFLSRFPHRSPEWYRSPSQQRQRPQQMSCGSILSMPFTGYRHVVSHGHAQSGRFTKLWIIKSEASGSLFLWYVSIDFHLTCLFSCCQPVTVRVSACGSCLELQYLVRLHASSSAM